MRASRWAVWRVGPLLVGCGLAASGTSAAGAAPSPDGPPAFLPETVVTATRTEQPLADVLADVTFIDRTEIERSGAVTVTDLLRRQAGIELSRNGGPGTTSSVFIRGGDNRFTAVYIDGVRVDSQATGGPPWEAIALGQIDHIEIVRGPAAAVYGSDAIAGVIQIFTRRGEGAFNPYAGVGVGNLRTARLEAGFSGSAGAVDYSLGAERAVSRGFNSMPEGNPDRDGYQQNSASGRLGWQISPTQRIDLNGTHTRMDARYDGFVPDLDDHTFNRLGTAGVTWSARWSDAWRTRVAYTESALRYETRPSPYLSKTRLRGYTFENEWRRGAHTFTATLERREDHLANDPIARGRHQNALALGYSYRSGPHALQVNLRHDRDSEFGGQTTESVAYGYGFAPGWRATVAAGSAFRVPTLYQRFSEYGAPGLQPEKSRSVEAGLRWREGSDRFSATIYHNRVRNLITFGAPGPCGSAFGCFENTGRAVLEGVTLSAARRLGPVDLSGSLDLQRPHDAETGRLLPRRARRLLKIHAEVPVQRWILGAEWQAASRRWDDADHARPLAGYGVANVYARVVVARDWDVLIRVDNLANRKYQLAHGFAMPPRTFFASLRWSPR